MRMTTMTSPLRVLVCGSRSWTNEAVIWEELRKLPPGTVIVTGGALGVYNMAERAAVVLEIALDTYGQIKPDLVLAFWDGESKGTFDTMMKARRSGITVKVFGDHASGELF